MSFLDKFRDTNGEKICTIVAKYMGGVEGADAQAVGILTFTKSAIKFKATLGPKFDIDSKEIKNIAIEGKDEVSRRVTVTRLLAVGIFAFALKKKTADKESYLTIELKDGREVIFYVTKTSPIDLKAKLLKATNALR